MRWSPVSGGIHWIFTPQEKAEVVANCDHLRRLMFSPTLPHPFTEHGAVTRKYDAQFRVVFAAIKKLMQPPAIPPKRRIGFTTDEKT